MAFDAFLMVKDIQGESSDDKHKNWIEILSFSHGVSQPASGSPSDRGGRSAERVNHLDFSVVKGLDKSSPGLHLACCKGTHIPEVTVELCRAADDKLPYMKWKMEDVLITSVSPGGTAQGGETVPMETVTFNYGKITWTHTESDHKTGKKKGDIEKHWDLVANKGG
jgi:type VI secretion system secreted protein Hcp